MKFWTQVNTKIKLQVKWQRRSLQIFSTLNFLQNNQSCRPLLCFNFRLINNTSRVLFTFHRISYDMPTFNSLFFSLARKTASLFLWFIFQFVAWFSAQNIGIILEDKLLSTGLISGCWIKWFLLLSKFTNFSFDMLLSTVTKWKARH